MRANNLFVHFSLKEKEEKEVEKIKDAHAGLLPRIIKSRSEFVPVAQHSAAAAGRLLTLEVAWRRKHFSHQTSTSAVISLKGQKGG